MHDLALQVGEVDLVVIADRDACRRRRRQIQRDGRAEAAGADDQRVRGEQFLLAFDADLRQQDVPAVAQQLVVVHGRVCGRPAPPSDAWSLIGMASLVAFARS